MDDAKGRARQKLNYVVGPYDLPGWEEVGKADAETDEVGVVVGAALRRLMSADRALSRAASLSVMEASPWGSLVRDPGKLEDGISGGGTGTVVDVEVDMVERIGVDTETQAEQQDFSVGTASTRQLID